MDNESQVETDHNQTVSLDTGLSNILNTELINLGPGPPSSASVALDPCQSLNLQSEECLESRQLPTKKRFRVECGRLGRNIRQRLLCGFFSKEGTRMHSQTNPTQFSSQENLHLQSNPQQDPGN